VDHFLRFRDPSDQRCVEVDPRRRQTEGAEGGNARLHDRNDSRSFGSKSSREVD
jgi:hypothetical protein